MLEEEREGRAGAWGRRVARPPTVSQVATHLLLSHLYDLCSCSISFSYFRVPRSAVFTLLSQGLPAQMALSSKETEIAQGASVSFPAHEIGALSPLVLPTCHSLPRSSRRGLSVRFLSSCYSLPSASLPPSLTFCGTHIFSFHLDTPFLSAQFTFSPSSTLHFHLPPSLSTPVLCPLSSPSLLPSLSSLSVPLCPSPLQLSLPLHLCISPLHIPISLCTEFLLASRGPMIKYE